MRADDFLNRFGNYFIKFILKSPMHGLLSKNTVLVNFKGRKSGRTYSTPVNYLRADDGIRIISFKYRTWWRNLRDGAPVILQLRGQAVNGWGEVTEDDLGVAEGIMEHIQQAPGYAKYYQIALGPDGTPRREDVVAAAKTRVVVRVKLD